MCVGPGVRGSADAESVTLTGGDSAPGAAFGAWAIRGRSSWSVEGNTANVDGTG